MTDPMDAVYNVLDWPAHLRPHQMNAVIPDHPKSIAVDCSCKDWAWEEPGTDQNTRNIIHAAHRTHVEEATK